VDVGPANEFEDALLSETAFGALISRGREATYSLIGERVLRQVDLLTSLTKENSTKPRLILAHLPSPHMPYVFHGNCRMDAGIFDAVGSLPTGSHVDPARVVAQADQSRCIDDMLIQASRAIVANDPNAIIILLSDHGPEDYLDWSAPEEPGLSYRFANFFWARTPGINDPFPDDVTLVNVFPLLFNALWGVGLPTHGNDMFVGPTPAMPGFEPYIPGAGPSDVGWRPSLCDTAGTAADRSKRADPIATASVSCGSPAN
jgi:hypothetical protein